MLGVFKKMFGGENQIERCIAAPVTGKAVSMQDVADPPSARRYLERERQ